MGNYLILRPEGTVFDPISHHGHPSRPLVAFTILYYQGSQDNLTAKD
ncbi:hypothetical protein ACFL2Q_01000 [Thermodesulfobacteriota bacterium]